MKNWTRNWHWLLVLSVLIYSGCAEAEPEPEAGGPVVELGTASPEEGLSTGTQASATPDPAETPQPTETKPVVAAPKQAPAETADAAMMAMIAGLEENQLELVWDFLPPSYQTDVDSIVQEFAGKMDDELWKKTFGVAKRFVNLLGSKKEFVLANPQFQNAPLEKEQLSVGWDAVVKFLQTFVNSEISDLEKLKKFSGRSFAAGTISSLVDQVFAVSKVAPGDPLNSSFKQKLAETKVTLVEENGDLAKVKIESPDEEPKEVEMARVEGHWIPKDLADGWAEKIGAAKAQLAVLTPESIAGQKEIMLVQLDAANQFLDQIEATKTPEELTAVVMQAVAPLIPLVQSAMAGLQGIGSGDVPVGEADMVKISVVGKLDDKTKDSISDALFDSVDNPDNASLTTFNSPDGKGAEFEVGPVKDVEAFSKKIEFGKVTKVDVEKRTITVEVGAAEKDKKDPPKKEADEKKKPAEKKPADKKS